MSNDGASQWSMSDTKRLEVQEIEDLPRTRKTSVIERGRLNAKKSLKSANESSPLVRKIRRRRPSTPRVDAPSSGFYKKFRFADLKLNHKATSSSIRLAKNDASAHHQLF